MKNICSAENEAVDEVLDSDRYSSIIGKVRMCCECGILVYSTFYPIGTLYICKSCPRLFLCKRVNNLLNQEVLNEK